MLRRENVYIMGEKSRFADRRAAGELLAKHVTTLVVEENLRDVIVLGLPRGGMMVASPIAKALGTRLDFVITRKLRAPRQPDLAIGAVTERGRAFLNKPVIDALGVTEQYIQREIEKARRDIQSSTAIYRSIVPEADLTGRTVVVVDDNVFTGSTMFATLRGLWAERPNHIIIALPVAPRDTLMSLGDFADFVITLRAPTEKITSMVGFYDSFDEITENEVAEILQEFVVV